MTEEPQQSYFFRIRQGYDHAFANDAIERGYVGLPKFINLDFENVDFTGPWREFNEKYLEQCIKENPEMNASRAGQSLASIHFFARPIGNNDIYIVPDGEENYMIGQSISDYRYLPDEPLPHQRSVEWIAQITDDDMSEELGKKVRHGLLFIFLNEFDDEMRALVSNAVLNTNDNNKVVEQLRKETARIADTEDDELALKLASDLYDSQPPGRRTVISEQIERNPRLARLAKERANYICEICGRLPFEKRNGGLYAEADHKQQLGGSNPGADHPDNMRCLCAQCHRVVTYGSDEEIEKLTT